MVALSVFPVLAEAVKKNQAVFASQKISEKKAWESWSKTVQKQATFVDGWQLQAICEKLGAPTPVWKFSHEHKAWERHCFASRFSDNGIACCSREGKPLVVLLKDRHYLSLRPPSRFLGPYPLVTENWLRSECWLCRRGQRGFLTQKTQFGYAVGAHSHF